jgi:hypothetical protein
LGRVILLQNRSLLDHACYCWRYHPPPSPASELPTTPSSTSSPHSPRWSVWNDLGGFNAGPSAASCSANRLDVFVRGARQTMLDRAYNRAKWYPVEPWLERQTDSTSSCAAQRPALAGGLEWRVDGPLPAGRTADLKSGRSVLGSESAGCLRPGSDNALYWRLTDAGL